MKYCKYCGQAIEEHSRCTCENAVQHNTNTKKNMIRFSIIGGIVCVIAIILAVVFSMMTASPMIDPFEYTEVTFKGIDSRGTVNVDVDTEVVIDQLIGEMPDIDDVDELSKWYVKYEKYYDGIQVVYEPSENLANGDTVNVTITVSDILKSKVMSGSKAYVVSGLANVETVDVFSGINVTFTGISGEARAKIEYTNDKEYIDAFNYTIDPNFGLKGGDIVTVTITNEDYVAKHFHVIPIEMTKEYIVPALDSYVTSSDQIPSEIVSEFAERFLDETRAEVEDDFMFTYSEVEYYGAYFLTAKEDAFLAEKNILRIYVYYDEYHRGEKKRTIYSSFDFENILISADGVLRLEYENGDCTSFNTDMDKAILKMEEDYLVVKID